MKNLEFTIRIAETEDAEKIYHLLYDVGDEDVYIMTEPGERTIEDIRTLIREQSTNRNLILVVESYGDVVGVAGFVGGRFSKICHVVEIGMAIDKDFRDSGLGSILLREGIAWARKKGFRRLELGVFSTNQRALSLYKKFGFQEEGVRRNRYRVEGTWVDEILMAKFL
ncbi:MAG: GNAT family N-acetyltransferase [Deltaproteobacteria bacterium]|nr:GNAT family N-acetyltransferase [Deltaproteobacteria bacterium]